MIEPRDLRHRPRSTATMRQLDRGGAQVSFGRRTLSFRQCASTGCRADIRLHRPGEASRIRDGGAQKRRHRAHLGLGLIVAAILLQGLAGRSTCGRPNVLRSGADPGPAVFESAPKVDGIADLCAGERTPPSGTSSRKGSRSWCSSRSPLGCGSLGDGQDQHSKRMMAYRR